MPCLVSAELTESRRGVPPHRGTGPDRDRALACGQECVGGTAASTTGETFVGRGNGKHARPHRGFCVLLALGGGWPISYPVWRPHLSRVTERGHAHDEKEENLRGRGAGYEQLQISLSDS